MTLVFNGEVVAPHTSIEIEFDLHLIGDAEGSRILGVYKNGIHSDILAYYLLRSCYSSSHSANIGLWLLHYELPAFA